MPFYQPHIPPTPPSTNLTGQTILITGATAGLGYAASLQFLRLRASKLIFGVRSITKGHSAAAAMLADPEVRRVNPNAEIKVLELDLVDYESVVGFAGKVGEEVNLKGGKGKGRLDVVLLNAGINLGEFRRCERSGWEMCVKSPF